MSIADKFLAALFELVQEYVSRNLPDYSKRINEVEGQLYEAEKRLNIKIDEHIKGNPWNPTRFNHVQSEQEKVARRREREYIAEFVRNFTKGNEWGSAIADSILTLPDQYESKS